MVCINLCNGDIIIMLIFELFSCKDINLKKQPCATAFLCSLYANHVIIFVSAVFVIVRDYCGEVVNNGTEVREVWKELLCNLGRDIVLMNRPI